VTPQNVNDDWPGAVRTSHGHGQRERHVGRIKTLDERDAL
jgi:hypothetical protein